MVPFKAPNDTELTASDFPLPLEKQQTLLSQERALIAEAPWPVDLKDKEGRLPDYVAIERLQDGRVRWRTVDTSEQKDGQNFGFKYRARVDIELVIDGDIVDLNRMKFPFGVTVVDRRFDALGDDSK